MLPGGGAHSTEPPAATPTFRGSSFIIADDHVRSVATGAFEPVEQHGLAGAARADEGDVVRWSLAAEQVGQALRQHRLFPLTPGECRRRGAVTGCEYAVLRRLHVDR